MVFKIGHRGMKSFQENTLESILYAKKYNMDAVEIDIQKTCDDSIILFHDFQIDLDNKSYIICETPYSIIKNKVETLSYVLSNIDKNSIKIFFDIKKCKNDNYFIYIFLNIIQKYIDNGWNINNFYYQSFYAPYINILSDFNQIIKNYGIIYNGMPLLDLNDINKINCTYICLDYESIDEKDIINLKKCNNLKIYLYTINEKNILKRYINLVDGIITDTYKIFL